MKNYVKQHILEIIFWILIIFGIATSATMIYKTNNLLKQYENGRNERIK
jgi:hypothetical protein